MCITKEEIFTDEMVPTESVSVNPNLQKSAKYEIFQPLASTELSLLKFIISSPLLAEYKSGTDIHDNFGALSFTK
jgi:hypothetical protein